ncbi:MAG TPA: tetratricopeptide repeat protein [Chloroflexota bacterium]|nr:tetratricopeptide repeat protein [Chloroflexota bacterium]
MRAGRLGWYWGVVLVAIAVLAAAGVVGLGRRDAPAAELAEPPTPTGPRTAQEWLSAGLALLDDGQWEPAARAFAEARALQPDLLPAYIHGVEALVFWYHYDEARDLADRAVTLAPRSSEARAARALVANWTSDTERALHEAQRAVEYDAANPRAHAYLAEAYADQYRLAEAQAAIDRALALDADDPEVVRVSGYVLETQQQYAAAAEEYARGIDLRPYWTHLHVALGHVLRVLKQYADAEAVFLHAAQIEPTNARPIGGLGMVYFDQEDYRAAIERFQQAIEIDPTYSTGYGQLGVIYYQRRDYPRAQPLLEKAVELERNPARLASYRHALGWIYFHAKDFAAAREQFTKALELSPNLQGARDGLALLAGR